MKEVNNLFNNANIIRGNLEELKLTDFNKLEIGEIENIFSKKSSAKSPPPKNALEGEFAKDQRKNGFDQDF